LQFDVTTLLVVHAVVAATLSAVLAAFAVAQRSVPGLRLWAVGASLVGVCTLGVGLRGVIPDFLSIVAANAACAAGTLALWNGLRQFNGLIVRWTIPLLGVAGLAAFLWWYSAIALNLPYRTVAVSLVLGLICLLCAREAWRCGRLLGIVAAVSFGLVALTMLARIPAAVLMPEAPGVLGATGPAVVQFMVSLVAHISATFCLIALAVQRIQDEFIERDETLTALARELDTARSRAERASAAKSDFLAAMSHELRTPLNAVIGLSDLMKTELLGPLGHPRYREYAGDIQEAGGHLLTLINSLLDLSKAEAGKLEIFPEHMDLGEIVNATLRLTRPAARAKGVALLPLRGLREKLELVADPQALKQVLINLVSNAIKFTRPGGAVTVRATKTPDGGCLVEVSDTGIGIAAEDLARVLRPFEQAQRTRYIRPEEGGTGLGLPLADALVRLHGGRLALESEPGIGTTVRVWLPAADAGPRQDSAAQLAFAAF
jgi:signal transduction histidine kinase